MEIQVINLDDKREYEIVVSKSGENTMPCPSCSSDRKKNKIKCFSYNREKEVGKCAHCGIVLTKKKEFIKKEIVYKKPTWKNNTTLSDKVIKWFEERGISQKTILDFKITEGIEWMPQTQSEQNTIQFNYFKNDELVNVKYRTGSKQFKLFAGAELLFYNIDSIKDQSQVVIVEGEMDAMAFHEAGIKNVISVPNGATLTKNNLSYIDNCIELIPESTEIILALDNDSAGNSLRDELARRFGTEKCYKVTFKDCKDANECLIKYGINGIIESISDKKEYPLKGVFTSSDISDEIDDYYFNGLPKGSSISMGEFDELLKFHKGYITTITGIPGHGKSEVMDFLAIKLNIVDGWKFALYSPENHPLQLHFSKFAEKIIGKSFVDYDKMTLDELNDSKKYFNDNFFFIKPEEDFTLQNILNTVKSLVRKNGVNAFVVDAWNKLDHKYDNNETKYISEQLDKIAFFCEINNVHCFLVAHPTKIQKKENGQYYVPNLYNINGSANFYNKTSNGITVYKNADGQSEIHVQKVKFKHWGKTGQCVWAWDKITGRFYTGRPEYSNWLIKEPTIKNIEPNLSFLKSVDYQHEPQKDENPF